MGFSSDATVHHDMPKQLTTSAIGITSAPPAPADRPATAPFAPLSEEVTLTLTSTVPTPQNMLLFAVAYLFAAWVGQQLTLTMDLGAALWPPSGLFLATLVTSERRRWPGWMVVAVIVDVVASLWIFRFPWSMAVPIAAGNSLEALVGASLLLRFKPRFELDSLQSVIALVAFAAFISPCLSASVGATAMSIQLGVPYLQSWRLWWVGDAAGVLTVAPLVFALVRVARERFSMPAWRYAEATAMLGSVFVAASLAFSNQYPFVYIVFPPLLWAALRFGIAGSALSTLILTTMATLGTAHGTGPFAAGLFSMDQRQLLVQTFVMTTAVVGLTLAVLTRQRQDSRAALENAVDAAEARAELRSAQLRESEETLRNVFQHAGIGLALMDSSGRLLQCNPRCESLLGYEPGRLVDIDLLNLLAINSLANRSTLLQQVRSRELPFIKLEGLHQLRNGHSVWLCALVSLLPAGDGEQERFVALITDTTEKKQMEDALREAAQRKDEFLATLAHELRNPLAPIRSGLAILRNVDESRDGIPAKVKQMMERQIGHLVRLIDDLLDVSRISSGKITLQSALLPLNDVVDAAIEASRPLIESSGHRFDVEWPAEQLWVHADLTRLTQVVGNLLNNAAKYTPRSGRITLSVARDGDAALIRVKDTGVGIPPDMLDNIFQMFTQVNRTLDRAQGGLGIGLALVHRLVHMHGGSVTVESDGTDAGSTFTVRLPVASQQPDAQRPVSTDERTHRQAATLRVLVVDDNADAAESMAMMLGIFGHETRVVHDGPQALAVAAEFLPDVALLDIGLPGMNGYEIAKAFRQTPALAGCLLVALTGWASKEDKQRAADASFDLHLIKPVDWKTLEEALSTPPRQGHANGPL